MVGKAVLTSILLLLVIAMATKEVSGKKKVRLAFLYNVLMSSTVLNSASEAPAVKTAIDVIKEHNVYLKDYDLEIYNYFRTVSFCVHPVRTQRCFDIDLTSIAFKKRLN